MEPIGLIFKNIKHNPDTGKISGELMIVHLCLNCGKISCNRIAGDDNSHVITCLLEKPGILSKEIITRLALKLFNKDEVVNKIKGTVASKGMAKGKVVIIRGIKDLPKVQYGSILVAITTHPDYTIAMRKANAIVTDEGGITCHAAIVSREYGIPCIVGTRIATKILKDGDKVEIDAVQGIVKIIQP